MSSPRTLRMNPGSDGIWVPQAKMILMSSVLGSMRLMRCLMNGVCFLVESPKMMAGLHPFSLSNGRAPIGFDMASLKAMSGGLLGRRDALTYRVFSGVRILLPPYSSRTDRLRVAVNDGYLMETRFLI